MKFKINLTGWGQEFISASITEEFFNHFKNNDISFSDYMNGSMEDDLPKHLLEVYTEDRRYDIDDIAHASGANYDDSTYINVVNEDGETIYTSLVVDYAHEAMHSADLVEEIDIVNCEHRYVVLGFEYSKGFHDEFELELDSEVFDPSKITILYKTYDEDVEIICGIKYDGIELDSNGELDTRGKGADWVLRDNTQPLRVI
jgi:hypothetical protein